MPSKTKTTPTDKTTSSTAQQRYDRAKRILRDETTTDAKASQAARPFVTGYQEKIADMVGDLLINGGSRANLRALVEISLDHEYRKFDVSSAVDWDASKWIDRHKEEYLDGLAAARAFRRTLPETERAEPSTLAGRLRGTERGNLEDCFEVFMNQASPEEISLLSRIMLSWQSVQSSVIGTVHELPLGEAFEYELNSGKEYVKVPRHMTAHVEAYAASLLRQQLYPASREVN